jgi:fructokinase
VQTATGVIVVGEALVDIAGGAPEEAGGGLAMTAHAGGSPANVAVGLARLGIPTQFAGRISRLGLGPFLRTHLEASGVDIGLCVQAPQPATVAIVGVDDAGMAVYSFYVEGTADWQWERAELPANNAGAAIHTGSLAIALEPGAHVVAAWIAEQRARGDVFISLDPNVRPALVLGLAGYRERLDSLIAKAHLVKVSDEDLRALEPDVAPLATATAWAERGPQLVVVTHGAGGATALAAGAKPVHSAGIPVGILDTIGAGDAFTAGLLAFLGEHDALRVDSSAMRDPQMLAAALRFAGRVAALTCTRSGADPPWRDEMERALAAGSV